MSVSVVTYRQRNPTLILTEFTPEKLNFEPFHSQQPATTIHNNLKIPVCFRDEKRSFLYPRHVNLRISCFHDSKILRHQ